MAAYVIGAVQAVNDPAGLSAYQEKAGPTLARYGGKFIAGGTDIEAMDGNWAPIGMIVIEFESMAKAKEWYNSPEYSAIQPERTPATDSGSILINGG